MTIHLYTICWNEARMLPYFLRYYSLFCDSMFVYDNASDDASRQIIASHPKCELRSIDTQGELREDALLQVKGQCWKESRCSADWVICCDVDEFLYHPNLLGYLNDARSRGVTIPVPQGFQMVAPQFPTTDGQIFDEVYRGSMDGHYTKRVIFDPTAIDEINYSHGCHVASPVGNVREDPCPELKLLHFKYMGREYVAERYIALRSRQSPSDRSCNFASHYYWTPDELNSQFTMLEQQSERILFTASVGEEGR